MPLDYYKGDMHSRVEAFECDLISQALQDSNNNQSKAARTLGLSERNLRYKLQKYGMK